MRVKPTLPDVQTAAGLRKLAELLNHLAGLLENAQLVVTAGSIAINQSCVPVQEYEGGCVLLQRPGPTQYEINADLRLSPL